jgi:hypothetical protein
MFTRGKTGTNRAVFHCSAHFVKTIVSLFDLFQFFLCLPDSSNRIMNVGLSTMYRTAMTSVTGRGYQDWVPLDLAEGLIACSKRAILQHLAFKNDRNAPDQDKKI